MNATLDQIAPEVTQALVTQASAQSLSVNDYLRHLLGLHDGVTAELALTDAPPRNEAMFRIMQETEEMMKDIPLHGSTEATLLMMRRARGGEMWGYEPTDDE
jgi:hypothetical protein